MNKRRIAFTALLLAVVAGLGFLPSNRLRTLLSLRKLDDWPLYVMHYYGDYGFEDVLEDRARASERSLSDQTGLDQGWACTCFSSLNTAGEPIFGRNFDWYVHPALVLFTDPPGGYASVSMVDMSYMGFADEEPSWSERAALLDAPLWPFDGMNEAGLVVGMMAVPHAEPTRDPGNTTVSSIHVIRLLLDNAGDVDEALALLDDINIDFGGGPPLHYLVSDADGDSAIVEFIDNEMRVLRSSDSWQVSTNFLLSEAALDSTHTSCWRYDEVTEALEQADGDLVPSEAMVLLERVSQSGAYPTIWSVVYDAATGEVQVVVGGEYDQVYGLDLEMQDQ